MAVPAAVDGGARNLAVGSCPRRAGCGDRGDGDQLVVARVRTDATRASRLIGHLRASSDWRLEDAPCDGEDTEISAVSETLFLPLYSLALESQRRDPIMVDAGAVELTRQLDTHFEHSDKRLFRRLAKGKLPSALLTSMSLRIRHYDRDVSEFLSREPDGIVVNLGCGLNDRRRRCDNARARWFDLDLPEVIALRRRFLSETDRMHFIAASVLDFTWLDKLPGEPGHRFLFVAEGLFMYLHPEDVRTLVTTLRGRFPGAELVAEIASTLAVRMLNSRFGRGKYRRQFGLSENVVYAFGLDASRDMEAGPQASRCSASGPTSTTTSRSWVGTDGSRSGRCCARSSTRFTTGWAPPNSPGACSASPAKKGTPL